MPAAGSSLLLAVTNCEQNLHGQQLSCGACIGLNWLPEKYAAITRVEACHDSTALTATPFGTLRGAQQRNKNASVAAAGRY